jgi:serine/threonine-protein kinase
VANERQDRERKKPEPPRIGEPKARVGADATRVERRRAASGSRTWALKSLSAGVSLWARGFMLVIVPAVLLATLQQAQVAERASLRAMEDAAQQVRRRRANEGRVADLRQEIAAMLVPRHRKGFYTGQAVGSWELGEVLGRGAMAEVHAARNTYSRVEGAAKIILPQFLEDDAQRLRFEREVEIATQLRSPFVVQVLEAGRTGDGSPCLVLERLHGKDLASLLRLWGPFDLRAVGRLLDHLGMGLDSMHRAGIVHRDIKPGNIFREEHSDGSEPTWKILDFGVSKFTDSKGTLTEGALVGTPAFMSPEQARGQEVDARADIYSLGAVAYRALTDRNPFRANTTEGLIFQVSTSRPVKPGDVTPDVPPEIELVLAVAMAPEPWLRFPTGTEFATAWALACAGHLPYEVGQRATELLARRPWRRL